MHAAPPVRMSLAPDRAWQYFIALCAGAAGANVAAWAALHAQLPAPMVIVAMTAATATSAILASVWAQRSAATGVLAWDGGSWQWSSGAAAPVAGDLRVMIDLGGWMLLRFAPLAPEEAVAWCVASRRHAGALWSAWRAALHARRPGDDPAASPDPK
jgi:hypothetical protein